MKPQSFDITRAVNSDQINKAMIDIEAASLPEEKKTIIMNGLEELSHYTKQSPLETDEWVFRGVIAFLGIAVIATIAGALILVGLGKTPPEGIIAIGSAAVGAMAGILTPRKIG
ncbi:hypothetical protein [Methanocalculus sp.]|uniref:hypothetical protein n=1 Tax=Methanocalculus sp. TaxID=2004547 RepID=UPI00271BE3BA|nr:hypothetical protein [Methanocalculus sp.]MDO8841790.1 hypothetical protein [Methanocalculus sp.]